jgi:hypothetical protein
MRKAKTGETTDEVIKEQAKVHIEQISVWEICTQKLACLWSESEIIKK